jgi:hypothetical protein
MAELTARAERDVIPRLGADKRLGQREVEQMESPAIRPAANKDARRIDIAMHKVAVVQLGNTSQKLVRNAANGRQAKLILGHAMQHLKWRPERIERQIGTSVNDAAIVDGDEAGRACKCLADLAFDRGREIGPKRFQKHNSVLDSVKRLKKIAAMTRDKTPQNPEATCDKVLHSCDRRGLSNRHQPLKKWRGPIRTPSNCMPRGGSDSDRINYSNPERPLQ